MHQMAISLTIAIDLDNTVWYGNYQRHGYIFSELLYRLKNAYDFSTSIHFPFDQFLIGWNVYTANLHLTAPEQLDMFLNLLIAGGFLHFEKKDEKKYFRQECEKWIDERYWHLVYHPEDFYIATSFYEYGRKVCLVPGIEKTITFLRQQKREKKLKIYAVSLNLQQISQKIGTMLSIEDVFDEVYGVTWNKPSPMKEEILRKILAEHHGNSNQVVIIGDAVGDITVGQKVGVKTVAIATGPTPYSELLACKPDKILARWPENMDEIEHVFS